VLNGLRCEGKGGVEMEKVPLRQYYKHLTCVRRVPVKLEKAAECDF
jgi:hypothetical protein